MMISQGSVYFILDSFFEKVDDPYLKINYETTKRPHYFAMQDTATSLYWLIPCSTKVDKFEDIIKKKQKQGKPTDSIKIMRIQNKQIALLFQDMFPIIADYIKEPYIRAGQPFCISDPKIISELQKTAKNIIKLLRIGIKFTPTQPDAMKIERLMLAELQNNDA